MRNLNDLARPDPLGSRLQLSEDRLECCHLAARHACDHESQMECGQIVLLLQFSVDGDKHIEALLREQQQRTIFTGTPPGLGDRPDSVARKSGFQASREALI